MSDVLASLVPLPLWDTLSDSPVVRAAATEILTNVSIDWSCARARPVHVALLGVPELLRMDVIPSATPPGAVVIVRENVPEFAVSLFTTEPEIGVVDCRS